jgi:O-methyltransferase
MLVDDIREELLGAAFTLIRLVRYRRIPDAKLYRPRYSPWAGTGDFQQIYERAKPFTAVSRQRCYVLWNLARQAMQLPGEFWECGVFRGGTAMILTHIANTAPNHRRGVRLFDTFEGMPAAHRERDLHKLGDFSGTKLADVRARVEAEGPSSFHPGVIPTTFEPLTSSAIAIAHIDVDLYQSVLDTCAFVYPRLVPGGIMLFDDYGFPSCPGARQAVDQYFRDKREVPLVLATGQALIVRLP